MYYKVKPSYFTRPSPLLNQSKACVIMNITVIGVEDETGAMLTRMLVKGHSVNVVLQKEPLFELAGMTAPTMSPHQWVAVGAAGCISADLTDTPKLTQILRGSQAIVVTLGRPSTDPVPLLSAMASIVTAAAAQPHVKFVMVSDLAAPNPGSNEWLQVLQRVETMAKSTAMDVSIIRAPLTVSKSDPLTRVIMAGQASNLPGSHHVITSGELAGLCYMAVMDKSVPGGFRIRNVAGSSAIPTNALHLKLPPADPLEPGMNLPPMTAEWLSRTITPPADSITVS